MLISTDFYSLRQRKIVSMPYLGLFHSRPVRAIRLSRENSKCDKGFVSLPPSIPPSSFFPLRCLWKAREAIKFMVRLSLTMSPSPPLPLSAPPATIFIFTLWK